MAVFIEGSLGVLYALAEKVAVRSVVPASQVTNALANNEARAHMALLLGRSLGGVLFGLGRVVPFVADVASFVLSLATLIPLRNRRSVPRSRRLNLPGDVVAGFKWLRSQPYFLFATIVSAALNCTAAALVLIYMTVAQGEGTDPFLIGLVVAIPGLSGIVGAGIAPSAYRLIGSRLLLIQVWVWMSALLPTLFLVNSISIGIVLAFGGFVGALVDVAVHSSLFSAVPEGMLARVASIDSLFGFLGVAVGPLAGGYLTQWFGMRGAVSALFIVMAGMAVLVTCSRAVRNPLTSIANH